jgi:hypothetical protein
MVARCWPGAGRDGGEWRALRSAASIWIDDLIGAEDESVPDVLLSVFGGGRTDDATDARPDLIFDPNAMPKVLVSGLLSPMALADGRDPGGRALAL